MLFKTQQDFYYNYQKPLAASLHEIEQVGILTCPDKLSGFKKKLKDGLEKQCLKIEQEIKAPVVSRAGKTKQSKSSSSTVPVSVAPVNLSSPLQVIKMLEGLGLKIPTKIVGEIRKKSTNETAIQRLYSVSGHPVLQSLLIVREFNKLLGYANTELADNIYYSIFPPCGTVGGRRSSRASWQSDQRSKITVGGNMQNFPKHSSLGMEYRSCFISRPGMIFVACDEMTADDWIINGIIADLTGITTGIDELKNTKVSRHQLLAMKLFNKKFDEVPKSSMEYYLAKKTRYSGSYGMGGKTMSEALAKDARFVPEVACKTLLEQFHAKEPAIKQVFQRYVENELNTKRLLCTPIGRRRQFFSLRSFSDNHKIYREGYSYIPLSTVGDNTGLSIIHCHGHSKRLNSEEFYIVQEVHDSIHSETLNSVEDVKKAISVLKEGYNRILTFPNGFEIQIPIEFEIGYSLGTMKSIPDGSTDEKILDIYNSLQRN